MQKYDSAYKYLFSNKTIFRELIESFVDEDFVKDIDFDNIELIDKSFVSEEFLKRESDIIYKLKVKGSDVYIYILLEFQSSVDKSIPVRMLLYLLQFYDLLFRNSQKGRLPNVFPILLYNGFDDWNIPSNINGLIEENIPSKYIPGFEYYKIIEKDIPDDILLEVKNLASAIIYLEKKRDEEGLKEAVNKIVDLIKNENIIDVRMFTNWFNKVFESKINDEDINKIKNVKEAKSMLALLAERIKEEGIKEGIREGVKEGIKEGVKEGIKEGIKEGEYNKTRLTAKKMLEKNLDVNLISEITGLTENEIKSL